MKCGVCTTTLINEAEEYLDGNADWWLCRKCNVARELEPYDKPETAVEQELYDQMFAGKPYFQPFSETIEALLADLRTELEKQNKRQQEPEACQLWAISVYQLRARHV